MSGAGDGNISQDANLNSEAPASSGPQPDLIAPSNPQQPLVYGMYYPNQMAQGATDRMPLQTQFQQHAASPFFPQPLVAGNFNNFQRNPPHTFMPGPGQPLGGFLQLSNVSAAQQFMDPSAMPFFNFFGLVPSGTPAGPSRL